MWRTVEKYKMVSAALALSMAFVLGGWAWAYFTLRDIKDPLVIHWNKLEGITGTGNPNRFKRSSSAGIIRNGRLQEAHSRISLVIVLGVSLIRSRMSPEATVGV